jgi:hypothetical protein
MISLLLFLEEAEGLRAYAPLVAVSLGGGGFSPRVKSSYKTGFSR